MKHCESLLTAACFSDDGMQGVRHDCRRLAKRLGPAFSSPYPGQSPPLPDKGVCTKNVYCLYVYEELLGLMISHYSLCTSVCMARGILLQHDHHNKALLELIA
eukprot:scaffold108688_cov16-Tisochrysis_lutea.AAC.3